MIYYYLLKQRNYYIEIIMKKNLLIFFFLVIGLHLNAEDRNKISYLAGIDNNCAFHTEIAYSRLLNSVIGIGAGIGYYRQWNCDYYPQGELISKEYNSWYLSDDDQRQSNFYIEPFLSFSTPALMKWQKGTFNLEVNTGLMLQLPYQSAQVVYANSFTQQHDFHSISTHKGDWLNGDFRFLFNVNVNPVQFSLGYSLSTLDLYSGYRKMSVEGISFDNFYPKKKLTHSIFLRFGIPF